MSRKSVLPFNVATGQSLATTFATTPTVITYLDNCSYQINVTTTNSHGTFEVQGSLDYRPGPTTEFPVANAGNWVTLRLNGGTPTVAAANDTILIDMNQLPFAALRLVYVSTVAGTGTCDIFFLAKSVGA